LSRIGVFGGTFDPPHVGHLTVAADVRDALELDRVLLIPAARPPHKPDRPITDGVLRWRMLRAAVRDHTGLEATDIELRRDGPSYTVDTLRALKRAHPADDLVLIMGVDQFNELAGWKEPEKVARLARIVVMAREGESPPETAPGTDIPGIHVPVTRVDVSSTAIREAVARGQRIDDLVPASVVEWIEAHELYTELEDA